MIQKKLRLHIKKIISLCILLFIGWFLYERSHYNLVSNEELKTIREKLNTLNPQEKKDLAHFFEYAILFCQYPYTLVDSKPMSICNFFQYAEDLPPVFIEYMENPKNRKFEDAIEQGYQVWDQYRSLFPTKKYELIRYHNSISKGAIEIALINTHLCLQKICQHSEDFHEILHKKSNPEEILEIITNPNNDYFHKVVEHHRLLGILLGFGRQNVCLFEQKKRDKLTFFTNEWPYWPRKWRLPGFVCDPTTNESKQLKVAYRKARKYIYWTYFNRDCLEVTLALLTRGSDSESKNLSK